MSLELFIIDATSPFFIKHPDQAINWSKIPFDSIEHKGKFKKKRYLKIKKYFERYIDEVTEIGYNAISIDDLCHMVVFDIYKPDLQKKIKKYRKRYKKLIRYAKNKNLKIFVTTDVMFFNDAIKAFTGDQFDNIIQLMKEAVLQLFETLPQVDGIIFRMGESDGVDVKGDFTSDIVMKTPADVACFLQNLLPVFEQANKKLIFRTWTIGAYKVGDLIWNSTTYHACFNEIDSASFILSMKHGEGDFFRFLELNSHFFENHKHAKLLEIQTRREYEGFGQYPDFVGWEYEKLMQQLKTCPSLTGINVWCQTGGWSQTRNFSFLKQSSFFTELNTFVVLALFKKGYSVEQAVAEFCPGLNQAQLLEFLRCSDEIIEALLYEPAFARQALYFNRVRVPPLFYVFWHYVTLTGPVLEVIRYYVQEPQPSLLRAQRALLLFERMKQLNESLQINYDHSFYKDTFELFFDARRLIFRHDQELYQTFVQKCQAYSERYPKGYQFSAKPSSRIGSFFLPLIIPVCIRRQKAYRWYDHLLFNYLTSKMYALISRWFKKELPEFVDQKAMPLEKLLR